MDARRLRRLALMMLLAWFCIDMTTPDIPGAFMFDPDASVEVLSSQRTAITPAAAVVSCSPCVLPVPARLVAFVPPRPPRLIIGKQVPRRSAHPAHAHALASPVEAD